MCALNVYSVLTLYIYVMYFAFNSRDITQLFYLSLHQLVFRYHAIILCMLALSSILQISHNSFISVCIHFSDNVQLFYVCLHSVFLRYCTIILFMFAFNFLQISCNYFIYTCIQFSSDIMQLFNVCLCTVIF